MARRPTLIFDGDCTFCARWVERWRATTGERVRYISSQEAAGEFPQIAEQESNEAVQWVGTDGERLSGSPAVFAALATASASGRRLLSLYNEKPWFARVADTAYRAVARNRIFFSRVTQLLWGADVRVPTFAISAWLFLRLLGAVYLLAFASYWVQLSGLNGAKGILPATDFFDRVREILGEAGFLQFPSVCWLGSSDTALYAWCGAGIIAAILLMGGFVPLPCLLFLWLDYLSLTVAGQLFYQYQWDILLLEAGFMSVLIAPIALRLERPANPPRAARFVIIWLLFRLIFASGVVKLTSGDPAWTDGTALHYHYFTQPLPTPLAWFAQQLPAIWQTISVWTMFAIELVLPFFLFGPRRIRLFAAAGHRNASALDRADRKLWVLQSVDTGPLFDVRGRCGLEAVDPIKVATTTHPTRPFPAEEVCSCGDAGDRSVEPGAAGGCLPAPAAVSRAADGRLRSGGSVAHHQWLRAFRGHDEATERNLSSGIG